MKIIFISGVKFGSRLLEEVLKNGFEVSAVFSYNETKKSLYSDFISFDTICKNYGIKNFHVDNINDKENIKIIKSINPDIILVMGWSQLLKNEIIEIPEFGVIGSHPTELPKFRGRAPIPWTILKELTESALTFFFIEEGIDNGDIVSQKKFEISENDDSESIYDLIINLGKNMIIEILKDFQNNSITRITQNENNFVEYWSKRTSDDGKIDWSKSAKDISILSRASTHPYPGAFTFFNNLPLKIFKASYVDDGVSNPGAIISMDEKTVRIGTGSGSIYLKKIQYDSDTDILPTEIITKEDIGKHLNSNLTSFQ